MLKDKLLFWVLLGGITMDILLIMWIFHTYDVVPDRLEYAVCQTTGIGFCKDREDFKVL